MIFKKIRSKIQYRKNTYKGISKEDILNLYYDSTQELIKYKAMYELIEDILRDYNKNKNKSAWTYIRKIDKIIHPFNYDVRDKF